MNQTRTLLVFALMFVGYLLWMAWDKDYGPQPPAPSAVAAAATSADASVPGAALPSGTIPSSAGVNGPGQLITISTDVLRLTVDTHGGSVVRAELLAYPAVAPTRNNPTPPPTRLLDDTKADYFAAQSGLVSSQGEAPDHRALFQASQPSYQLANGQNELNVDLSWQDAAGLKVTKRYTVKRGSYVVALSQRIVNGGNTAWQGNAYQQLQRAGVTTEKTWWQSMTDPSSHSFFGAAWYSPQNKFESLPFNEFQKKPLNVPISGGWAAMLQHYFFVAWIPAAQQPESYSTAVLGADTAQPNYLIRTVGPAINLAPGQSTSADARLYVGPKLQGTLDAVAPGLDLSTNYGWFTVISQPLHWLLSKLEAITHNWGLAIIALVLLIKAVTWKLTATQFRSAAKMRKLQPRVQALKERYGDDKMKMQQAMMELYKKEKVNPMTGCLPLLITMPVFFGLYRVLLESVELRQAPFFGWIHDLAAPDPFFILPIVYVLIQLATQWLTPTMAGMDPTQAKMMKVMPLLFAVLFAFFPSGLVLYWIINGGTSLAQQWFITRSVEQADAKAKAA